MLRLVLGLLVASSVGLLLPSKGFAETANRRPNVVFILADDLGYSDLACYGSKYYETPNIDRLAGQGVKLLNHHHCQNCAPTRAALMTGQYAPRTGVYTVGGTDRFDTTSRPLVPVENVTQLPLDRSIIAKQLKEAGYVTGIFGKWHLGEAGDLSPGKRGFDEAILSSGKHFDFKTNPPVDHPPEEYLADFLTDRAVDFIKRHKEKPFFLYLPHYGVHSPFEAKQSWIDHFKDKPAVGGQGNPVYAAMIASVDESVGRVVSTLDELGLTDQTIVIFASDNGGVGGYSREGLKRFAPEPTDNFPVRSGKGSLYEGGTRVPMIAQWPGQIPAGSTIGTPTIHVDLYPTLLEIAGAKTPSHTLDGESLVPLLKSSNSGLKRTSIFQHFPGYLGAGAQQWRTTPVSLVQQGDWKLMEFLEDGHLELYNLKEDLGETTNLIDKHPEKSQLLHAELKDWREKIQAPMPAPRDPKDVVSPPQKKKKGGGQGKGNQRLKSSGSSPEMN